MNIYGINKILIMDSNNNKVLIKVASLIFGRLCFHDLAIFPQMKRRFEAILM